MALWAKKIQKATFFAATKLLQQGVLEGALFGIEHLVLPEAVWSKLRRIVVTAVLGRIPAVKTEIPDVAHEPGA